MHQWKQAQHQIMYGFVNCVKNLSKKCNYQSQRDRCKVYEDQLKANCIDDEFKQQLKQEVLNEVKMCLNVVKDDVVNVRTNKNIKQSCNFKIT